MTGTIERHGTGRRRLAVQHYRAHWSRLYGKLLTSYYSLAGISCVEITSASNQIILKEQASRSTDTASSTTVHNQNVDSERRLLFMDYRRFYKFTLYPRKRTARSTATQWWSPKWCPSCVPTQRPFSIHHISYLLPVSITRLSALRVRKLLTPKCLNLAERSHLFHADPVNERTRCCSGIFRIDVKRDPGPQLCLCHD